MPPMTREIHRDQQQDRRRAVDRQGKDLAPKLRKVDEPIPFWESDCIFLDRKMGKDRSPCWR